MSGISKREKNTATYYGEALGPVPHGYYLEIEEEEESWLRPQTAVVTPRAGAHWDGASTDGEELEEELEMSEGEHNVESGGNSDL